MEEQSVSQGLTKEQRKSQKEIERKIAIGALIVLLIGIMIGYGAGYEAGTPDYVTVISCTNQGTWAESCQTITKPRATFMDIPGVIADSISDTCGGIVFLVILIVIGLGFISSKRGKR